MPKPKVNLFLLFPETKPSNPWMHSAEENFFEVESCAALINDLKTKIDEILIENYEGFYDNLNVKNFLCQYDILEDYYPLASKKRLQRLILNNSFVNWREDPVQSADKEYTVFSQPVIDHTFCEIAERKRMEQTDDEVDENYALLNHHACKIQETIQVIIEKNMKVDIDNIKDGPELLVWFAENRLPQRNFSLNPKHGENNQTERFVGGERISPLRCSGQIAQELLSTAIGLTAKALFNLDPNYDEIIVFKYEGSTPQNIYHGYHVAKDSEEVPIEIRKKLNL